MKLKILSGLLFLVFLFAVERLNAQTQQIKGTVISKEDQETMPGVNVLIKGTLTGVVTDINGKYTHCG